MEDHPAVSRDTRGSRKHRRKSHGRSGRRPSLSEIAREDGRYPEAAFQFLREGVEYASLAIHGPMTPVQLLVTRYMVTHQLDFVGLQDQLAQGTLDSRVAAAIEEAGGCGQVNRNVSGQDLCWALRDLAWRRWGLMARCVWAHWGITRTEDLGRIVYAMVDRELMQKEPHDSIEDFRAVYDVSTALNRGYRIAAPEY